MSKTLSCKAILFAVLITCTLSAQTPVERHGNLSVQGNKVLDASGQPVQLRGMSLFWSQWANKYWNSSVISWLKSDWKVTIVRAAMGVETINPEDKSYLDDPARHKGYVKTVVDAAIANGLYVIIDWHDHNAHNHTAQAKAFFEEMATTYKNYPNVIYEIFNEPEMISWSTVKTYSQTIISAIRAIDPDNLIIVGTPKWCQDVDIAANDPINATNIVYSLHFYAASHKATYRAKAQTALDKGVALFVSEFGTCENTGNGVIDEAETNTWFSFLDQNKISWANWSINDKAESASALVGGASTSGGWSESSLTQSGKFIRNKLRTYAQSDPNPTTYTLTTTTTGQGTVSRSPNNTSYASGATVTLTANPANGYVFSGWSGDASGSNNPLTVTMNGNKNITATFTQQQTTTYTLTTTTSGQGSISRSPNNTSYASGASVTLTANPANGYVFSGWSGDASGSTNPLTVTMNGNKNITATFTQQQSNTYTLTTNTTGQGAISRSPNNASYASGATVTLTANPATGYVFSGWSGDASGTTNPLTVTMNGNKSITATFTEQQVQSGEMIVNGSFSSGESSWSLDVYGGQATGAVTNGEYETSVTQAGTETWNVQFTQTGLKLEQGKSYKLTFKARAAASRSIVANIGMSSAPYTSYMGEMEVSLSSTMQTFTKTFTMNSPTDMNARIEFNSGLQAEKWYIDDVSLVEVSSTTVISKIKEFSVPYLSFQSNELNVSLSGSSELRLYDVQGRIVKSFFVDEGGSFRYSLFGLPAGSYFLQIRDMKKAGVSVSRISVIK